MLVGGELKDLPPAKRIAAARLVFPVVRANGKSATKAGVTLLGAPFEAGKPYDFKNLGDVLGSTILPNNPARRTTRRRRRFAIEVTRAVRSLASGEAKFNGFALRTIPDRSVDEGYTVRFDLPTGANGSGGAGTRRRGEEEEMHWVAGRPRCAKSCRRNSHLTSMF